MKCEMIKKIISSWKETENCANSFDELFAWIDNLNKTTHVKITDTQVSPDTFWHYDGNGDSIINSKGSFFTITGIKAYDGESSYSQPVIIQDEIGYLGIVCKEINGVLHFLMQAKIEPGNINCVQLSPTIQATKSNFTRAHGGKAPAYLEYFQNASDYKIVFDQIQSEQASRFYKKRNRNIIICIDDDIDVLPNFRFMTLGQIKKFMKIDNLVNMDTRTVLSSIAFVTSAINQSDKDDIEKNFNDKQLFNSIFNSDISQTLPYIYQKINNFKMFDSKRSELVSLNELDNWECSADGIVCKNPADFSVGFYDIEIEGREVVHWTQPLFKAQGIATFGLITKSFDDTLKFLVKIKPEAGSFDGAELGPAIQWEPTHSEESDNAVDKLFRQKLEEKQQIVFDTLLSEEGGRFYHEQNRNVIIRLDDNDDVELYDEYMWADYATLNFMMQINNTVNIQLRNLISLIDI